MALARKPFVVLDAEMLSSSVWSEAAHVRLVWITLLILCDTEGYVGAALPGIARAAGVTIEEAQDALGRLQAPDPHSRTKENEGRRLEVAERGWRVLNFIDHLNRLSNERTRARDRVWRHRQRAKLKRQETTSDDKTTTVVAGSRDQGEGNSEKNGSTYVPPPDVRAENSIRAERWKSERRLLTVAQLIGEKEGKEATEVMRHVTAYKRPDGTTVLGRVNPAALSVERLEKSLVDAEAWLAEVPGEPV